jgi:hypothetical protein
MRTDWRRAGWIVLAVACSGDPAKPDTAAPDTGTPTVTDRDSDGDGLTDQEELALGTNPNAADSDLDRLEDGEEVTLGTDPRSPDTDLDGHLDGDEVEAGSDPLDGASLIYDGRWPYYADKHSLEGPPPDPASAAVGTRFTRFALVDQFGWTVDLYDFYNADKPVVIDISAQWCEPCWNLATWLEGGADPDGHTATWPAGPAVIERGDVYWITVLSENEDHLPADTTAPVEWVAEFPTAMPVLADDGYLATDFVGVYGYPTLVLLEPDLTVTVLQRADPMNAVLTELAARFPQ